MTTNIEQPASQGSLIKETIETSLRGRSKIHVKILFPLRLGSYEFDTPNPFDRKSSDEDFEELARDLDDDARLELRKEFLEKRISNSRRSGSLNTRIAFACVLLCLFFLFQGTLPSPQIGDLIIQKHAFYAASAFLGLIAIVSFGQTFVEGSLRNQLQLELDIVKTRQRISSQLPIQSANEASQNEATYFDRLVKINVENLSEYYALVKVHTNNSFRAAIAAGLIGFGLIVFGLIVGLVDSSKTETVGFISAAAGVITNFIAGVFFYLYNRTVRQLKGYHDSLLDVQNVLLSFKIIGDMPDTENKVTMVMQMVAFLISNKQGDSTNRPPNDPVSQ